MEFALIIALLAIHLTVSNPVYRFIIYKLGLLNRKPFNCSLCMAFWLGVIGVLVFNYAWFTPFVASFLAALIEKIYNALPTVIR